MRIERAKAAAHRPSASSSDLSLLRAGIRRRSRAVTRPNDEAPVRLSPARHCALRHNYHPFTGHQAVRSDYGYHSRFRQRDAVANEGDGQSPPVMASRRRALGPVKRLADPPVIVDPGPLPAAIIIASRHPNAVYPLRSPATDAIAKINAALTI